MIRKHINMMDVNDCIDNQLDDDDEYYENLARIKRKS